jgi:hypothetical protein
LEDNADQVNLRAPPCQVVCVENVPLYAWYDTEVQQVIGKACSLDYIEEACVRREYTKPLCVWA